MLTLTQRPDTGERLVKYSGECLKLSLTLNERLEGEAFVRTNLGRGSIRRREVIEQVEHGKARFGRDWHDIPMPETLPGTYSVTLPLCEIGMFEFKCFFLPKGGREPLWTRGENSRIKVEPAVTSSNNTIYNAFVRQFGSNKGGGAWTEEQHAAEKVLDAGDYTVIPPSGKFRDLQKQLPFIMKQMGFRIVQLLPIHPVPVTFARMGRYGSPFAPLDFSTVDSSMAVFDKRTTPLEQFCELVDSVHSQRGLVLIDLPADHTGWASTMQVRHPEWFCRNEDGSFASPGAWGVTWEDLCKLNFTEQKLWVQMAEVFLGWAKLGVDGFRCDAGYMLPMRVWEYIAAKVREQYPDTIFFLEGLGGPPQATEELLQEGRLSWAYSELFQCYSCEQIKQYLRHAYRFSERNGCLVNFAETHDNDRLAAKSPQWAALRTGLAALMSVNGAFGIANGVEWLATEKIDVHGAASLNWGKAPNLVLYISRLNKILRSSPAFGSDVELRVVETGTGGGVGVVRRCRNNLDSVMVIANPDEKQPTWFEWEIEEFDIGRTAVDLLSGGHIELPCANGRCHLELQPGKLLCLASRPLPEKEKDFNDWQLIRDYVLKAIVHYYNCFDVTGVDLNGLAELLQQDSRAFLRRLFEPDKLFPQGDFTAPSGTHYLPYVDWDPEQDAHRVVMIPPHHVLLVEHEHRFRALLIGDGRCLQRLSSFRGADGRHHAFFTPHALPEDLREAEIQVELHNRETTWRVKGRLLLLPTEKERQVSLKVDEGRLESCKLGLCSNGLGGYVQARACWGELLSKYDAFLAACPSPDYPEERKVLVSRFRIKVGFRDYTVELGRDCQTSFTVSYGNRLRWKFTVPSGMGHTVGLTVLYSMDMGRRNCCQLQITRTEATDNRRNALDNDVPVTLRVRPEIDCRTNHETTKAYLGAENGYPMAVKEDAHGFVFAPNGGFGLRMWSDSVFKKKELWRYSQVFPEDAERGLESQCDEFSPGEFQCELRGGETFRLGLEGGTEADWNAPPSKLKPMALGKMQATMPLLEALRKGSEAYLAYRDRNRTVIAGFPWFLDWGRDTLICLRGFIAAGRLAESRDIIRQFASFEKNGTIPNMIKGNNDSDRATSDAPLWMFVAVGDFMKHDKAGKDILSMDCGGRTLLAILESIAQHLVIGAANGVQMDKTSGLLYSPSHYTWMDTNYPAGTPRQGYPLEIQALWIYALTLLDDVSDKDMFASWLEKARNSLATLYVRKDGKGLSDCLHAAGPQIPAKEAIADDAVRPNQLLVLTLTNVFDQKTTGMDILAECARLLLPGAIRSLASASVAVPLRIERDGKLLNNPYRPYWGQYTGDEDTLRKPAYHNGTAWGWQMPLYCEALVKVYGAEAVATAHAIWNSAADVMSQRCIGHLPEICDGDAPHTVKGCPAQAWSMCEFYRVGKILTVIMDKDKKQ